MLSCALLVGLELEAYTENCRRGPGCSALLVSSAPHSGTVLGGGLEFIAIRALCDLDEILDQEAQVCL